MPGLPIAGGPMTSSALTKRLADVLVEEEDPVRAGQVLAHMDGGALRARQIESQARGVLAGCTRSISARAAAVPARVPAVRG
jgi:multidrug efflux pump subunit AcrA (membrane-fusion protein)